MEQWEKELREKLDKELPNGSFIIHTGNWSMCVTKSGYIEFEIAMRKQAEIDYNITPNSELPKDVKDFIFAREEVKNKPYKPLDLKGLENT